MHPIPIRVLLGCLLARFSTDVLRGVQGGCHPNSVCPYPARAIAGSFLARLWTEVLRSAKGERHLNVVYPIPIRTLGARACSTAELGGTSSQPNKLKF